MSEKIKKLQVRLTNESITNIGLNEDSLDLVSFNFSECYYGLMKLKGKLLNLKNSLKLKEIDLELMSIVEEEVLEVIESLKPFL